MKSIRNLLMVLSIGLLAQPALADQLIETFDAYTPGTGFTGFDAGEGANFQYVTDDALTGGDRVGAMSDTLGANGMLEIFDQGAGDNALRATSDTGFADGGGFVSVIDLPGFQAPLGGPLASALDLTGNTFSISARQTQGLPAQISWLLISGNDTEVIGSSVLPLTGSFQQFQVPFSDFAADPNFGSFDVSQVVGIGWDIILQSGTADEVTVPIIVEFDNAVSIPVPGTAVLLGVGAVAYASRRRR